MKKTILIPLIISIIVLIISIILYEYYVNLWGQDVVGPIIRVDVIMVYPVLIGVSALCFWISRIVMNKKNKDD